MSDLGTSAGHMTKMTDPYEAGRDARAGHVPEDGWTHEAASVEVWRWGRAIRVAIRSENSVGKAIELSLDDAMNLAERLVATINADKRRVKDDPRA